MGGRRQQLLALSRELRPDLLIGDIIAPAADALEPCAGNIDIVGLDDFLADRAGSIALVNPAFDARLRTVLTAGFRIDAAAVDAIVSIALAVAIPAVFLIRIE